MSGFDQLPLISINGISLIGGAEPLAWNVLGQRMKAV
jgi:hypothetical protein